MSLHNKAVLSIPPEKCKLNGTSDLNLIFIEFSNTSSNLSKLIFLFLYLFKFFFNE